MNSKQFKKILTPSVPEIIICLAISLGIISLVHFGDIIQFISQSSALTSEELTSSYKYQLSKLDQFEALRTVVIMSFWAAVGVAAYVLYLVISQAYTSLRNEVVIDTQFTNRGKIGSRILPILFHLLIAVGLFVGAWLTVQIGIPAWIGLFELLLYQGNWLAGIISPLIFALNIYILWVQFEIVKYYA